MGNQRAINNERLRPMVVIYEAQLGKGKCTEQTWHKTVTSQQSVFRQLSASAQCCMSWSVRNSTMLTNAKGIYRPLSCLSSMLVCMCTGDISRGGNFPGHRIESSQYLRLKPGLMPLHMVANAQARMTHNTN